MRGGVLRLGGGVAASDCPDVGTNVLGAHTRYRYNGYEIELGSWDCCLRFSFRS